MKFVERQLEMEFFLRTNYVLTFTASSWTKRTKSCLVEGHTTTVEDRHFNF